MEAMGNPPRADSGLTKRMLGKSSINQAEMKMRRGKTAITDDNSKWGHTCKCRDAEIDK